MAGDVAIRLLGPIEISVGGRSHPVAGAKLQALLAQLALETPQAVSDDRLIEELWGDEQPSNPVNALQALVSALRRLLGREVVARHGTGYVLRVEPDRIDAVRLGRLVEEAAAAAARGDHRTAATLYRKAMELRRGRPLGELGDNWFARHAVTRLDQLGLTAMEGLVDSELALGRHDDVRGLLLDLVTQHPLRERFHAQLVLTLYRSGRQADALRAVAAARRHLRDELGLEPGPELRDLELAVLAHDPSLRAPVALGTTSLPRSSVPEVLTSFEGRAAELAVLDHEDRRLVTLVGPAGVGKTRLAVEWARRRVGAVALYFVELTPVTAESVGDAIATAVGTFEQDRGTGSVMTPLDRAAERVAGSDVWLILDNCEHVVVAAAQCAFTLLTRCPGLRIVATSREPLGVDGEHLLLVDPLDVESAGRLFVDRARSVQPLIDRVDAGDLSELCVHLDGLPLALELAAARTRTLPVPEIAARLRDRFDLLQSTRRPVDERHHGLRAAIDWSYELLFEDERRTFRRLAVFNGGASPEAIVAVCGEDGFDVAMRLVNRSLVTADTSGRETRFGMLESLRDYGRERLVEAGELDEARAAHLSWCVSLVERVNAEARGPDQLTWLDRLDRDHGNVVAALGFGVDHEPQTALRLVNTLFSPWWSRGRRQDLRHWFEACLAAAPKAETSDRAIAVAARAYLAEPNTTDRWRGELEDVLETAEHDERTALAMAEGPVAEPRTAATIQMLLTATMLRRAAAGVDIDHGELRDLAGRALEVFIGERNHYGAAGIEVILAIDGLLVGDVGATRAHTEAARLHAARTSDRYSRSRVEYLLGMLAEHDGELDQAYRHCELAYRLLDELGMQDAVTSQARLLEQLAERSDQPELAAQWRSFIAGRSGAWSYFDGTVAAASHNSDGIAARLAGDHDGAAASHQRALDWYRRADLPHGVAISACYLGFLALERDDRAHAAELLSEALVATSTNSDTSTIALVHEGIAAISQSAETAANLLGGANRRREESGAPRPAAFDAPVEQAAAHARDVLGDASYRTAFTVGATMSPSALGELARRSITQVRRCSPPRPAR